jgi:Xaa-Pro aminopeptidase
MRRILFSLSIILIFSVTDAKSQLTFEKAEYASRREKLMDITPGGIAIIRGASVPLGNDNFSQFNNMMYFAGVEIPDLILVIDSEKRESTIFFTIDERTADGENISLDLVRDPVKYTGIKNYLPYEDFTPFLEERVSRETVLYTPFSSEELPGECSGEKFGKFQRSVTENEWDGRLSRELQFAEKLKERFPGSRVENCTPQIWGLRKIKSKAEVDVMRRAAQLGVEAHLGVIKETAPGVEEVKLAALFNYICMAGGAKGLAFSTIIMSAEHHAYGHYAQYDRTLENGDFVILDAGPDVDYYATDISTTFPVNGRFSENQKQVYELALMVREICLKNYRPGISLSDVGLEVKKMLVENGYDPDERRFSGWIRNGGYNHSIGMAVHDRQDSFERSDPLQVGFVFACDIMAKADSVTSVRIEDTVVITEDGCEVLSSGLPRTIEEIERFMNKYQN